MQKLCVLIQSGKMLVEQERMEVIHGGFFVSWTGSRKADRFLLDIYSSQSKKEALVDAVILA